MKLEIYPHFGGNGRQKIIEFPDDVCAYLQDYDGAEYIIYSKEPIFMQQTTRIDGEWITQWVELDGRITEGLR